MIRLLIREMLLQEEVFGALAFVYTGSHSQPWDVETESGIIPGFIPMIVNDDLQPGKGKGGAYGKGLYTVYDLEGTKTEEGFYGNYIYKLAVNLHGYLCFDMPVAAKVYGKPLTIVEQAKILELDDKIIEKIKLIVEDPRVTNPSDPERTAPIARVVSHVVRGIVKGLVFTGAHDGRVAVVFDASTVTPIAYRAVQDEIWKRVSKDARRQTVGRTSAEWRSERYDENPVVKFERAKSAMERYRRTGVTPNPEDLIINGDLDLTGGFMRGGYSLKGTGLSELPEGLHVKGELRLDPDTTTLPRGLRVDGDFDGILSKISEIPDDAQFGGKVSAPATLRKLPENMTVKSFTIAGWHPDITEWPPGFVVLSGTVGLYGSSITRLPDGFVAPAKLSLFETRVEELPRGLRVGGDLDIRGTNLQLRDDIEVGGYIYMNTRPLSDIPKKFRPRGMELDPKVIMS